MLRRDGILFRRGVIPALVLSLLLAAAIAAASVSVLKSASEGAARAAVVLVDLEDSLYSRIAVGTVKSQSYMENLLQFDSADSEEEALAMLRAGRCAAVIVLPEGYLRDIMAGSEAKGRIILSEAAAASAETVGSVALFGERLLAAGQYGVFAGQHLIWDHGLPAETEKAFLARSNAGLLDAALSLFDEAFTVEVTAYDGTSLSAAAYYAVAWLVLFFLLSGLFFMGLYLTDDRADMLTRLYALGVTPQRFFLGKWLWPLLFHTVFGAGILILIGQFIPLCATPITLLSALAGLSAASLFTASAAVLTADAGAAFGIVAAGSAAGLFLMGGIVPRSMLSRPLVLLGRFSPSGLAASFFAPLFGGAPDWLCMALALCLCAALYLLTLRVLSLRPIRKGGSD